MTTPRVTVPVEPTEAMLKAADAVDWNNEDERASVINMWQAILSAAPAPEGGAVKLHLKLLDTLKPFAEVAEKLKHCHVVEICEPTPDNPSRNIIPIPREWFERAADDLGAIAIQLHSDGALSEGQVSKLTGLDRVEVRKMADALATREEAPAREGVDARGLGAEKLRELRDNAARASTDKERGDRWHRSHGCVIALPKTQTDGNCGATVFLPATGANYVSPYKPDPAREADFTRHAVGADPRTVIQLVDELLALRAQPQARGDAQPFMFAYEDVDKPGEWRAFRHQIKHADGSICPGRPLYTHSAPDALRLAVEALREVSALRSNGHGDEWESGFTQATVRAADIADQALAALQAEQKGGA